MENLKLMENGLIKVYKTDKGEFVVDGRELWQGLEVGTEFRHWIKRRLEECDAEENVHYFTTVKKDRRQKMNEYTIKLRTAKEMAMLEHNEIGKKYRRYLIEVEEKYQNGETAKAEIDATKEKLAEAKLRNAKAREASLLLKIADQISIPEYKQIMQSKAAEVLTGEMLLPLPKTERKTYSATEIGERLGISANKVGKIANANNLKTADYGLEVWDKAKHSNKQVATWRYYDSVLPVLEELLNVEMP